MFDPVAVATRAREQAFTECSNCHHIWMEHTGRSLWSMFPGSRDYREPDYGRGCEHRMDFHHTCSCPRWFGPDDPATRRAPEEES